MTRVAEALLIALGLLILGARFAVVGVFTAGLPALGLVAFAVLSGAVRTAVLLTVFPLVAMAWIAVHLADALGQAVPAPRWPRVLEVA
ncbi:hypothetical protein ABT324_08840 [Saccharopolyspora sp. NPDC000359]|uniref:hypothetical protein n=1 Tax=Saccharopolyspora sp. NPDC000359 TaxID=3154251 RepID=UPI00332E0988